MRKTVEDQKQALISGLVESRRGLLDLVHALPAECADVVFLGVWSLKDLVAHLIGWDKTNLEAVQAILAGCIPAFFSYYDKDWQSYNRGLVEKYRKESLSDLIQGAEESHGQLIAYLASLSADEVVHGKVTPPSGRTVTVRNLLRAEAGDEAAHMEQVKAYFRQVGF